MNRQFLRKYSGEIKISVLTAAISTFVGIVVTVFLQWTSPQLILTAVIGSIIILLLLAVLFNAKRLLSHFLLKLPYTLPGDPTHYFSSDKYWERLSHFSKEKALLARVLVDKTLPDLVKRVRRDYPNMKHLHVILDSGTTITPIFKELANKGIQKNGSGIDVTVFTNNLAGIEEIHQIDDGLCLLDERTFNLIGGQPLRTYRATTGDATLAFLDSVCMGKTNGEDDREKSTVTVGIVTSNWFTCRMGFDRLSVTAKGAGHLAFKKKVIDHSDYVIIVSPLGKLLPLESHDLLNKLAPEDDGEQYESFTLPDSRKDRTYLLTTQRPERTLSPLAPTSIKLKHLQNAMNDHQTAGQTHANYRTVPEYPTFEPPGDKYQVIVTELPHAYIRDHFSDIFCEPLP